jgi:pyruvate formate lyase activating enzyme
MDLIKSILFSPDKCNKCGKCSVACDKGVIYLNGLFRPIFANLSRCDACMKCESICENNAIEVTFY